MAGLLRREDSPDDISRGLFAGEVGTPRLLKLFERLDIKTSWFIPGHSIETFPDECRMIAEQGHEIGMHGYSHENPIAMWPEPASAAEFVERGNGYSRSGVYERATCEMRNLYEV